MMGGMEGFNEGFPCLRNFLVPLKCHGNSTATTTVLFCFPLFCWEWKGFCARLFSLFPVLGRLNEMYNKTTHA